ncbi:MAG: hypothetical protein ACFFBP_22595 [Promethearchaeota archaeon]
MSPIFASGSASMTRMSRSLNFSRRYLSIKTSKVDFPTPPFPENEIIFFMYYSLKISF